MPDHSIPDVLPACGALRAAFLRTGYGADSILALLGADAHAALGRGEPVPVRRAVNDGGDLGTLVRLFLLGDTCSMEEAGAALAPLPLDAAVDAGLVRPPGIGGRAALDVRPLDTGTGTSWLVSD
ncbi:MAG: DUF7059 domain-containing protein, partial [Mycobacteriaceae bacterium]